MQEVAPAIRMSMILSSLPPKLRLATRFALLITATGLALGAPTPEETSPISPNISDKELVEFSKAERSFAAAALPMVQARICVYAEAAETHAGQPFISEMRTARTTTPPRSLALTNAILAARLYLDFTPPAAISTGDQAATWNELGLAVLERSSFVLHHYYLAVEYRRGHDAALTQLRKATRELSTRLSQRVPGADRLQSAKAHYAALWFERCDEVLPVYRQLLGQGVRGYVRDALVLRSLDLPLVTGWTWEERKRADAVQKQFIQELSTSTNLSLRIEGLLLSAARTRTDRAFTAAFTNALEAIDLDAGKNGTRTAYANVVKELLEDRHSKTLTDRTRNELRRLYDARFVADAQMRTNSSPAIENSATQLGAFKPAVGNTPRAVTAGAARAKAPLSWQMLLKESDIHYWETLPMIELRALATTRDVIANYYLYLKLRDSEAANAQADADAALDIAFKAGFPQAQLAHAKRLTDAEERFHWTKTSASTGYPAAQLALGELHIMGHGAQMDLDRGLALVRGAYDLRVPEAEVTLAELYASGIGEPRTLAEKPEALFLSAARNDQPAAMIELHHRFLSGFGVVRDQLEASRWLVNAGLHDKAALEKYLDPTGKSRPQPSSDLDQFAKTLAVYSQAVIHKQPDAINHVAEWYQTGSIGRKSPIRAYALFSLAGSSKAPANALDRVKSALTPHELRTAETLVTQWQQIRPDLM